MVKSKDSGNSCDVKRTNLKWTEEMDDVFIDAMLEQLVNGNKIDGSFTPIGYGNMVKICTKKFGFPCDKNHLKNRIKSLKENFNKCFDLFNTLSGFAWNPITQLFEAENEVWEALIHANPSATKWRYTKIHAYKKLYDLFGKDRAKGKGACSAKERRKQWEEKESEVNSIDIETSCEPSSPTSMSNYVIEQPKHSTKKARIDNLLEKKIEVLESAIGDVVEVMRRGNAITEKVAHIAEKGLAIAEKGRPHFYSENEVFDELQSIEVPENCQLDAFLFLNQDQQKVRAFFGFPRHRRKELLLKMMFP